MLWLANSVRTQGVDDALLETSPATIVTDSDQTLTFQPRVVRGPGLIFISGSGIAAAAYAPLLRPIADAGHPVVIVKLPYRFAPMESHKTATVRRVRALLENRDAPEWVLSGHSLGAALACRAVKPLPDRVRALVLIATTHPKRDDLSSLQIPVTKVYATKDGVAPFERIQAGKALLPPTTRWVEITGGNHSQFGSYGRQLFDGTATIGRETQQTQTRAVLMQALLEVSHASAP